MQTGLKKKHPKCAKQFYLQASYDCAINIYTTVVFASNLSFLKCRHAGSVFTKEEQKGWLWLLCMPAMLMMSQKGWLWLLCMPAMLMMSEIPTAKHKMAAFAVVFSGLSMSVFNKPDYKPTEKHT